MSGQWEVVGKKKGKNVPPSKKPSGPDNKNNFALNSPKVEEVFPLKQVKNLYALGKNSKENRKPLEKAKPQENGTKKVQKKQEKPQEQPKPKPKSIESALNSINLDELKACYENSKRLFPEAPLIWLKETVQFLNQKIPVEVHDLTFSARPASYPISIVPASIRGVIEQSIKDAGRNNAQLFFDMSLTSMANDMSKNLSALGHKLYIQYLAQSDPHYALTNLSKHVILRNSYQNRQPIGLSILWAIGQAGVKDLHIGLKVFQEIMLPVIEMKNYSHYVTQYFINLISRHSKTHINKDQYLLIMDVAFANYKNFPNALKKDMLQIGGKLEPMLFGHDSNEKYHTFIEPLLKKLQSSSSDVYRNEICKVLTNCFVKDQAAFGSWSKNYTKCLPQSAILLNYIGDNYSVTKKFNKNAFKELLNTFTVTNEELLTKKKKEIGLVDAVDAIKRLNDKMVAKKKSGFPYKSFSFICIGIITALVYCDIHQHGGWNKSRTYIGLKDAGVFEYTNKAIERSKYSLQWAHERIDRQFPGYYEKTAEIVEPYVTFAWELSLVACNTLQNLKEAAIEKYPAVVASIDSYAPGFLEQSQKTINNAWSTSVVYFNRGIDYLKTEVFVGQLAPENMQKVVLEALNTTQQKAAECYHWIYEKVQSTIK